MIARHLSAVFFKVASTPWRVPALMVKPLMLHGLQYIHAPPQLLTTEGVSANLAINWVRIIFVGRSLMARANF